MIDIQIDAAVFNAVRMFTSNWTFDMHAISLHTKYHHCDMENDHMENEHSALRTMFVELSDFHRSFWVLFLFRKGWLIRWRILSNVIYHCYNQNAKQWFANAVFSNWINFLKMFSVQKNSICKVCNCKIQLVIILLGKLIISMFMKIC